MTFRFTLQPLLDARERGEDECRSVLAAAAREAADARARAKRAGDDFSRAAKTFSAAAVSLPPEAVRESVAHLELLAGAIRKTEELARSCGRREKPARDAFAAARLERRRVEALRDRAFAAFERESERHEMLALEEANAAKHNSVILSAPSFHN